MAVIFSLYGYGVSADVIDFDNSTSLTFTGYRLRNYTPGVPSGGFVTDQIVCDIHGNGSVDDALTKLSALERAVRGGEMYRTAPRWTRAPFLRFKPPGATNFSYSIPVSGSVAQPRLSRLVSSQYIIHDVVVTITREAQWRHYQPMQSDGVSDFATRVITPPIASGEGNVGPWGKISLDGGTYPTLLGDLPAPTYIEFSPRLAADGLEADTFYFAHKSDFETGQYVGYSASGGIHELVEDSLGTAIGDSDASGGTTIRANFVTNPGVEARATVTVNDLVDKWKVLLRASTTSGTTARSYITWQVSGAGQVTTNPPIEINSGGQNHYRWFDMGNIRIPPQAVNNQDYANSVIVILYSSRSGGTGEAFFDTLFLLPIDEAYSRMQLNTTLSSSLAKQVIYSSLLPIFQGGLLATGLAGDGQQHKVSPNGTFAGQLLMRPGKGTFYWLTTLTNSTNGVPKDTGTNRWKLGLSYVPVYAAPRGA